MAKQESGLTHDEGRDYTGLIRRRRGTGVIRHTREVIGDLQRRNAQATKSHKRRRAACVT